MSIFLWWRDPARTVKYNLSVYHLNPKCKVLLKAVPLAQENEYLYEFIRMKQSIADVVHMKNDRAVQLYRI